MTRLPTPLFLLCIMRKSICRALCIKPWRLCMVSTCSRSINNGVDLVMGAIMQMTARMDQMNSRMDQIFDGLNNIGLRVGQIKQTTININKRLTVSNLNLSIQSQNSIIVRDNMTIHPLYSMATSNIIVSCPTTTAKINRITTKFYYIAGCLQIINII
ncbi:hypothetical protein V8C34DRAFT_278277 [Trichoderma compactum]